MFQSLSSNLLKIFDKLTSRGIIKEEDVNLAMREIRIALLEADVALPAVKFLIENIKKKAIGQLVVKTVTPGQMIVKIVQDELTQLLTSENHNINLSVAAPAVIMMVGLQGSGKTTSCAKLALKLNQKKILLASLDTYRPAAQEQLAILAKTAKIDSLEIIKNELPIAITKRAMDAAKLGLYDILILDTAGRLHIDDELMDELKAVKKLSNPIETILVADSLTGQDAANIAKVFNETINITSIILTRIDGDSRGGAALSMKYITGCPIKFIGNGEKLSEFEEFHPERIASRILGMGDVVSLVERASNLVNIDDAEKMAKRIQKGIFNLNDMLTHLKSVKKLGGLSSIMSMIPGIGNLKNNLNSGLIDDKIIEKQVAIILSMTKKERVNIKIINYSRKTRIALGSGTSISEVNLLLKQYQSVGNMMKKLSKMDKKSFLRNGIKGGIKGLFGF